MSVAIVAGDLIVAAVRFLARCAVTLAYCRRSQRCVSASQQRIQIGQVWIVVDEEIQAFAIVHARPLAVPRPPPRIIRVEVRAPECLPTAMRTAFDVAAFAMAWPMGAPRSGQGSSFLRMLVAEFTPARLPTPRPARYSRGLNATGGGTAATPDQAQYRPCNSAGPAP